MASTTSKTSPRTASKQAAKTTSHGPTVKAMPLKDAPPIDSAVVPAAPAPSLIQEDFRGEAPEMLSNSEVYDEADQAQWIQLAEQSSFRERARLANAPETHPDFDGQHCIDCGEEIPAPRLALFKIRCVECQRALEAQRRIFAR